jgi:acyl-CoA synthetase (NDP forming)/RimJ/RimL family protein N-acetyltransferase
MGGVAHHRKADVLLADGATVHLRPIRPDDADAIVALHSRFSERTRYMRYFAAYPRIPPRDLARFVNVDHHDREAFVVELGVDLIAVGRYERLGQDSPEAEVAFVVEDAHQGRGIGSVLIEHLAAAAQEEGIERFVADVLPVNQVMLRVFADAGFRVEREFSDGLVHLWFPIASTEASLDVQRFREQRAEGRSIERLLAPRGVAVYGARADGTGIGAALLANLRAAGFTGAIVPVHPSARKVVGLPAVRSLGDIASTVDLAVVAVPAAAVPSVVEECAAAGVHGLVVVSAGFAEHSAAGAQAQAALVRAVRGNGMRLVGPNCLGVANTDPAIRLNATLAPLLPGRGNVGFFSQSAALGIALLAEADRRGLGLSSFVSAGNRADVSGNDVLQYWRQDPATDVVLLYLETFGNPRKFARIARALARDKPVVAVASPVRGPGVIDARGVAALFASSGVIRVDTVAELFDVGLLAAGQPLPAGFRLGVVTNAAALGVLTVAKAPAAGLVVAPGYPVDVGPSASAARFVAAVQAAIEDSTVDAVLAAWAPIVAGGSLEFGQYAKPLVRVMPGGGPSAVYPGVEEAVRALGRVAKYAAWRREPLGGYPALAGVDVAAGRAARDGDALLAAYGIRVVPATAAVGAQQVREAATGIGYPVAVKVTDAALRHRIDLGAVRLDLASASAVERAYDELEQRFGVGVEVVVQRMVPPGVACVVEVVDDPAFGPAVGFGVGGPASELLGDRAWRPVPLTDRDAAALVRAPRAAPLLTGYRGSAPVDLDALSDLLLRVGRLVDDRLDLAALTLNPVLATPDGYEILHATIHFGHDPRPSPDAGPRRL